MSKCERKFHVHSAHCCGNQRISLSCFIFETSLSCVCYSAQFGDAAGQRRIHSLLKACLKFLAYGKRRKNECVASFWVVFGQNTKLT